MNASSQNPTEALPSDLTPVPPPMPDAMRAAYAAYGATFPAPAGSPAAVPEGAPATVTTLQAAAAAAVMDAEMQKNGTATSADLAEAERTAGILFDAAHVQAAVDAAAEQARTECAAELAEAREHLGLMAGAYRQLQAVMRLCEGRPGDDLLLVSAVALAAERGSTALDGLPMTLTWSRSARVPDAHDTLKQVVVECTSAYGGRADLVIDGDDRMALASLLSIEARDINAPCPTDGCGTVDDYDAGDPALFGWSRLQVACLGEEPRWYCSDMCVFDALARAGHELKAEDRADAVDPDEHAPVLLTPEVTTGWETVATDLDRRYGPGASDEHALQVAEATEAGFEDERGDAGEDGDL